MKILFYLLTALVITGTALEAAVPTTPSVVKFSGRKILLERRLTTGKLSPAITFTINALNWNPVAVGSTSANWAQYYAGDINLISAMNASVVRIYSPLPMDGTGKAVMDYCYTHNIYVIMNVGYYPANTADLSVTKVVRYFKNHPALLMFEVGNEWNYNNGYGTFGTDIKTCAATVQRLAGIIQTNDAYHPVTSSIGNAYDKTPFTNNVFKTCSKVDVWGFNTYLVSSAAAAVTAAASYTTKPIYFSEIGTDAYNHLKSMEDQPHQASYTLEHWKSVAAQLTIKNGPLSGETFFEFSDEWWKAGSPATHDVGGVNLDLYDGFGNEEWWGFVDVNRKPREVYKSMQTTWKGLNVIPTT